MKKFWKDMGIAVSLGFVLPAALLAVVVSLGDKELITDQQEQSQTETVTGPSAPQLSVAVLEADGQVVQMDLDDYLTAVVLAEMPVSFEEEALKAQTVVARTYTIRAYQGAAKHEQAVVCTQSSCCQGYLDVEAFLEKGGKEADVQHIRELIAATRGEVLTYDGKLIEATYFSCSGGSTEDAVAVWGTDVPYLQAVASPGEEHATHYTDTVTFSELDFAAKLGLELTDDPGRWFGAVTYTDGGGVNTMEIGGKTFTGTQLRSLLGLRSTAFEMQPVDGSIMVTTRGFGHRVGMSQYGADAMAERGSSYQEILAYYYQGTQLTQHTD